MNYRNCQCETTILDNALLTLTEDQCYILVVLIIDCVRPKGFVRFFQINNSIEIHADR